MFYETEIANSHEKFKLQTFFMERNVNGKIIIRQITSVKSYIMEQGPETLADFRKKNLCVLSKSYLTTWFVENFRESFDVASSPRCSVAFFSSKLLLQQV
uniref:Uncharacterized protein n=1 Tax=Cacopsylla melanoneura TaxID=428564 RepID=A0A8D8TGI3_9HEMI